MRVDGFVAQEPAEVVSECLSGPVTLGGIFLQTLQADRFQVSWDLRFAICDLRFNALARAAFGPSQLGNRNSTICNGTARRQWLVFCDLFEQGRNRVSGESGAALIR